nr:leucine carboxyl methyltransferase 1 [Quercus suber]
MNLKRPSRLDPQPYPRHMQNGLVVKLPGFYYCTSVYSSMASIPNLHTLRSGRRRSGLRGGRSGRAIPENSDGSDYDGSQAEAARDRVVQQTDHDASSSRSSAVSLGYLDDPYARVLFPDEPPKRYPIINRGTFVRTTAIDQLVNRFIASEPDQRKQIVSLGAGSDTRYFRMLKEFPLSGARLDYYELDFEVNVNRKRTSLRQSADLSRLIKNAEEHDVFYHLHALDLRDLTTKSPAVIPNLQAAVPTLLISECCLCYLPPDVATSVIQYFSMNITAPLALVLYEPIRPYDAFGKTMVTNLASRGIHLQTLKRYSSLEAQRQRLRLAGMLTGQGARDVFQLWQDDAWISPAERERIEKLEWLDEIEEWQLLSSHYCVAWGWRGDTFSHAWQSLQGSRTSSEDADVMM